MLEGVLRGEGVERGGGEVGRVMKKMGMKGM